METTKNSTNGARRTFALKSEEEFNAALKEMGYEPDEDFDPATVGPEHPFEVEDAGDVMRVMRVVAHIQQKIAREVEDLEAEIKAVKEFRQKRIESLKDQIDYLTLPLRRYIQARGDNYNGPAGHAGFHTVTRTEWKLDDEQLARLATEKGLKVKATLKGKATEDVQSALQFARQKGCQLELKPYKSDIKKFYKEQGEGDDNEAFEKVKERQFRVNPS